MPVMISLHWANTPVYEGGIQREVAGQGGQTKREITKSHSLLWDISGARILMYHEEHSLLNGHFTHFFLLFIPYSKTQFQQKLSHLLYFCYLVEPQQIGVIFFISQRLKSLLFLYLCVNHVEVWSDEKKRNLGKYCSPASPLSVA